MRRRTTKQHKALQERRVDLRLWKLWRRERLDALLAGPYAEPAQALLAFFKAMTGPTALIDFIKAGPWAGAPRCALRNSRARRRDDHQTPRAHGLVPLDDALPGQTDNLFLILRESSRPVSAYGGATRGVARLDQRTHKFKENIKCRTILLPANQKPMTASAVRSAPLCSGATTI